ncbi:MAG TPA: SpoIID/LytB domain-containing protein [Acidimicrobiales bacterium]|nr:SpoIID/LytB domain-containing protein [Acidimicrobiales bacterium]
MRSPLRVFALICALVALPVIGAPSAHAYPSSHIEFEGHGWGHGRGLGQYGSLGYAVDEDWPYSQILDHFYGGTTKGTKADGIIGVKLVEFDGTTTAPKDMIVTSSGAFTLASSAEDAFAANEAARVRYTAAGWVIERGSSCSGPWTVVRTVPTSTNVEARTAYAGDDVNQMINVCGVNKRAYRGTVMMRLITESGIGFTRVINYVAMEQYLRGVVPRESPASWGDADGGRGLNALKAQTVAARSYAWAENRNPVSQAFKTCDTTACQVYGGAGLNGTRIEHVNTDRAISQTTGEVRVHPDGAVARTEFSSSTGGHTAGGTFPAVPDTGDDVSSNPNHQWNTDIFVSKVQQAYPSVGTLQTITVSSRNGLGQDGGRALNVRVVGDKTSLTVSANDLRSKLGLKSDWYRIIDPSLNAPAVGIATLRTGSGVVITSTAGEALSYGEAGTYGSMEGIALAKPVVGMALTATGKGYWLAASDGGVFQFGDAPNLGSLGGRRLNKPIVGIAATPSGRGFYLVASDGGIFTFGDATYLGSMGAVKLNQPVVGMAVHPTGQGYYLVARDGGIFTFGSAVFRGSTGNIVLNRPILGMTVHPRGLAYWFVASDGGVFSFPAGNRYFYGSLGGTSLAAPIAGMATTPTGNGYWLLGQDGALFDFGDAAF